MYPVPVSTSSPPLPSPLPAPLSLSLPLAISSSFALRREEERETRYTCKHHGRACVYERARLYTYESRRISGHTTGAEISFIYPRLPASLLTVYPQHLVHHDRVCIRPCTRDRACRVYACTRTPPPSPSLSHIVSSVAVSLCDSAQRRRYAVLFAR